MGFSNEEVAVMLSGGDASLTETQKTGGFSNEQVALMLGQDEKSGLSTFSMGGKRVTAHPDLGEKLLRANADMVKATGFPIVVSSSFRTHEQQIDAYNRYLKGEVSLAAKPGMSRHEKGLAVDVTNWREAAPFLKKYGLVNPFDNDRVHFQLAGPTIKEKPQWTPGIEPGQEQHKPEDAPGWAKWVSKQTEFLESPVRPPTGDISDTAFRLIPEGIDKAVYQMVKGGLVTVPETLGHTAQQILSGQYSSASDLYTPYLQMAKGIYDSVGEDLGLKGIKALHDKWANNPGGALAELAMVFSGLRGRTGVPKYEDVGIGENLRPPEPPPRPLTPVSKSARESAEVFIRELEKPKSAEESAAAFTKAEARGEWKPPDEGPVQLPERGPLVASRPGLKTQISELSPEQQLPPRVREGAIKGPGEPLTPEALNELEGNTPAERVASGRLTNEDVQLINTSFSQLQGAERHVTRIQNLIEEAKAKKGGSWLPNLASEAGSLNVGDIAEWARDVKRQVKLTGATLTPDLNKWLGDVISRGAHDENRINTVIGRELYKALKPAVADQKTFFGLNRYPQLGAEAVKTIIRYKDELGGKLPEFLRDFSEAVWTVKRKIFEKYNDMAVKAGGKGATVKLDALAAELDKEAARYKGNPAFAARSRYAKEQADYFRSQKEMNVLDAQEQLSAYNLKMKGREDYHSAGMSAVDAMIADHLRKGLDSSIEQLQGPGYARLKKQYGALTHIERDINRRAVNEARAADKTLPDTLTDSFASYHFVAGILRMHPGAVAASMIARAVAAYDKAKNSPSKQVSKMFKEAEAEMNPSKSRLVTRGIKGIVKEEVGAAVDTARQTGRNMELYPPVALGAEREREQRPRWKELYNEP